MSFRDHVDSILSHATAAFGEDVKFLPDGGGIYIVKGIFNNEYQAVDLDLRQVVSDNQPTLGINLNDIDFEFKAKECDVEIRGLRFRIIDKREDGQGGALLMLHRKNKNERLPDTKA